MDAANTHALLLGPTRCGKTTLMHALIKDYAQHGVQSLVFNPHREFYPVPEQHQFTDLSKFLKVARASKRCALIIEEAGEFIGRGKLAMDSVWITTGCAKWGHVSYVIAHTAGQLLPAIRGSCGRGFIFRQSEGSAGLLVEDFADKRLMKTTSLKRFEFVYAEKMGDVRVMKLPK